VRQGPREKFNSYMAKLGEKEQELYETCGRTPMGKHRCSPEAQLMRLEGGLDVAFSKFARDQAFRDNRGWPNTVTEASCLLNYYWQACERQLPEQAALLTTEQKNNEGAKGKKRGSQAFEAGKENKRPREKERTPEAQKQWEDSNEQYKKLKPEQFQKIRTWQKKFKALRRKKEEPDADLINEAGELNICIQCRCYGHAMKDCKQN